MIQRLAKINNVDALFLEIVRLSDRHCVFSKNYQNRLQRTLAQNKHFVSGFDGIIYLFEKLWDKYPLKPWCTIEKSPFNYCTIGYNEKNRQQTNEKIIQLLSDAYNIESHLRSSYKDQSRKIRKAEEISKELCIQLDSFYYSQTELTEIDFYFHDFFSNSYHLYSTSSVILITTIQQKILENIFQHLSNLSRYDHDWNSKIKKILQESMYRAKGLHTDKTWQYHSYIFQSKINKNINKKIAANYYFFNAMANDDIEHNRFERINNWLDKHAHNIDLPNVVNIYRRISWLTNWLRNNPREGAPPDTLSKAYLLSIKPRFSGSINIILGEVIKSPRGALGVNDLLQTLPSLLVIAPYSSRNFKKHQIVNAFDFCEDVIQYGKQKLTIDELNGLISIRKSIQQKYEYEKLNSFILVPGNRINSPAL